MGAASSSDGHRKPVSISRGTVFGGGAFGTATALLLVRNGAKEVRVWHPSKKDVEEINKTRRNDKFLKGVGIPSQLTYTVDAREALFADGDRDVVDVPPEVIVFAIPTQFLRGFLTKNKHLITQCLQKSKVSFMACKGIESKTLMLPTKILEDVIGRDNCSKVAVVAGPSFAIEVAQNKLTGVTIAARTIELARLGQQILTTQDGSFRCYASAPDMIVCEVASAMKNVVAIAAGAADGLGLGRNARALIITRGVTEIVSLARGLAHTEEEKSHVLPAVMSLAGIGDMILTCTSSQSRNFTVGRRIGKGESLDDIKKSMTAVAEGVATAEALTALSRKLEVRLPLCETVNDVLAGRCEIKEALKRLTDPSVAALEDEPALALSKL
jgi:glycerol-3-phosphate dehydrogenase